MKDINGLAFQGLLSQNSQNVDPPLLFSADDGRGTHTQNTRSITSCIQVTLTVKQSLLRVGATFGWPSVPLKQRCR